VNPNYHRSHPDPHYNFEMTKGAHAIMRNIYDILSTGNTIINGGIAVIVAFIMAKVESTKSRNILEAIRSLDEVEEAYLIYGAYDLLIKCVFKTPEALSSFVVNELRKVDGIKDTITNVCASCD
jgi:DNA-binding Lrp family transcriptional regulator